MFYLKTACFFLLTLGSLWMAKISLPRESFNGVLYPYFDSLCFFSMGLVLFGFLVSFISQFLDDK